MRREWLPWERLTLGPAGRPGAAVKTERFTCSFLGLRAKDSFNKSVYTFQRASVKPVNNLMFL